MDWEFGVSRYKLLYLEWLSNEVLLYSTGNYIQSLEIMMEDNIRKRNVCVCIYIHECVYIFVTLLYRRNWHNIVNQTWSNKKNK